MVFFGFESFSWFSINIPFSVVMPPQKWLQKGFYKYRTGVKPRNEFIIPDISPGNKGLTGITCEFYTRNNYSCTDTVPHNRENILIKGDIYETYKM